MRNFFMVNKYGAIVPFSKRDDAQAYVTKHDIAYCIIFDHFPTLDEYYLELDKHLGD